MKRFIQFFIFFLFINVLKSQCPVPKIIFPNGGEELINESKVDIIFDYRLHDFWEFTPVEFVYFYYSIDGGDNWIFENTIPIDESELSSSQIINYTWDISNINSENCLIKVQKYEGGCWAESDSDFSIAASSIVPDNNTSSRLTVYPNPIAQGEVLNVEITEEIEEGFDIQIMDTNGKLIKRIKHEKSLLSIHTENLDPGKYILLYRNNESVESKVFIVH